jgi:hypothetical protein
MHPKARADGIISMYIGRQTKKVSAMFTNILRACLSRATFPDIDFKKSSRFGIKHVQVRKRCREKLANLPTCQEEHAVCARSAARSFHVPRFLSTSILIPAVLRARGNEGAF